MKKPSASKEKPPRIVTYFTADELKKIEARAHRDGIRTPSLWVATSIRKQLVGT